MFTQFTSRMGKRVRQSMSLAAILLAACALSTCAPKPTVLQQVRARGTLRVITLNGPTTYYIGPRGKPSGFDYDAARQFAHSLGVRLRIIVASSQAQILSQLNAGQADMAAAALAVTPARRQQARFTPALRSEAPELVYRRGAKKPTSITDLNGYVQVVEGSGAADLIRRLANEHPGLSWGVSANSDTEDLLYAVSHGKVDYTVADSDMVDITQRYYPNLESAFKLGPPQPLAWAFPRHTDDSLYNQAIQFVLNMKHSGALKRLVQRYFSYVGRLNYVGRMAFLRDARKVLPQFEAQFKKAANRYGLDWRLLAAMSYQESHWKPHARSPTGVKGIMMLTLKTARDVDIRNRLNPAQSIMGGARYLHDIMQRLPDSIEGQNRTWMALAAYNIGFGHLMDARALARSHKANPNLWQDVRSELPLLSKRRWYRRTRFGYARGYETVDYVAHIRTYYDVLVWLTTKAQAVSADASSTDHSEAGKAAKALTGKKTGQGSGAKPSQS